MLKLFKSRQHTILGIDINPFAVKFLQLIKSKDEYSIASYGCVLLPKNAIENHKIINNHIVIDSIRKLATNFILPNTLVAAAIPDALTMVNISKFHTDLSAVELESLIYHEAAKLSCESQINVDFIILKPFLENKKMQEVLIVAAKKENVDQRVNILKEAGIKLQILDVESYAIVRVLGFLSKKLPAIKNKKIISVLRLESSSIQLIVLQNLEIIFFREELLNEQSLLNATQLYFSEFDYVSSLTPSVKDEDLSNTIFDQILKQIKKILKFYFANYPAHLIEHVFLMGDLLKLEVISQLILQHTSIPTTIMNPFQYMRHYKDKEILGLEKYAPSLIVACGLALN